jgi:hypothetical protein
MLRKLIPNIVGPCCDEDDLKDLKKLTWEPSTGLTIPFGSCHILRASRRGSIKATETVALPKQAKYTDFCTAYHVHEQTRKGPCTKKKPYVVLTNEHDVDCRVSLQSFQMLKVTEIVLESPDRQIGSGKENYRIAKTAMFGISTPVHASALTSISTVFTTISQYITLTAITQYNTPNLILQQYNTASCYIGQ